MDLHYAEISVDSKVSGRDKYCTFCDMQLGILQNDRETFWHVHSAGRQRLRPGSRYWFENQHRSPLGVTVVQAITQGWIELHDHHGVHRVEAGSIVVFTYGDQTAYGIPSGGLPEAMHCEWAVIAGAGLSEHFAAHTQQYGPFIDTQDRPQLLSELRRLSARAEPDAAGAVTEHAHAVHHFVMRLFEGAADRDLQNQSPVQRAVGELMRRPEAVASLQQLADVNGCSREHLSRVFRETAGVPAQAYLTRAKLDRALMLLGTTSLPLRTVAAQSGFATTHTLARQVRRHTGRSPSAYRSSRQNT